jgi:phosphoglycolate phosphatase-like HAD superfamily hydrolase
MATTNERLNDLFAVVKEIETIKDGISALSRQLLKSDTWVPDVVIYQEAITALNKFDFKTCYTPFIGREAEMSALFDFLDSDVPFAWCMLEAAGGTGKSRVANEFCLKAEKEGWVAGFYDLKLGRKPKDYKHLPENLLIFMVVDYALANEQNAADLLKYLHEHIQNEKRLKGQNCQIKIRLMLLDRAFDEIWKNKTNEFAATSHLTKDGKPVPLQLQNTNEDLRWPIIQALLTKEAPSKWKSVCEQEHEILESLHAQGHTMVVATSKPHVFASRIVTHFGLDPFFTTVYGSELDGTRVDKRDLLRYIRTQENLRPDRAVMIGDREHDVFGAKAIEIPAIGVRWGYGSDEELQQAGVHALVNAPHEIDTQIKILLG